MKAARPRNRRGEGERLRDELLQAALVMVEAQDQQLSLRAVAREVGVAATSVYMHFPDFDHLLAAVVEVGFAWLLEATTAAAEATSNPADELRARCRAYCQFGIDHPGLYLAMFDAGLPQGVWDASAGTPGLRSFENLVAAVRRVIAAGVAPPNDNPFRLASLVWTGNHGLVMARLARPSFPWPPFDGLVDEMVNRVVGLRP